MPGGFAIPPRVSRGTSVGALTATSLGTSILAGASANTKGAWTQVVSSSAVDSSGMLVSVNGYDGGASAGAMDIGVGGSGSEVVLVSNLMASTRNAFAVSAITYFVPCAIPAGTRISARCQTNGASDGLSVSIILFPGSFTAKGYAGVDAIGFVSGSSLGTAIDPGGTINTKPTSYTQLILSTARDYAGFFAYFDGQATVGSGNSFADWLVDIAIGGAGVEVPIVPNLILKRYTTTTFGWMFGELLPILWVPIPAGTRLSCRAQCSINTATVRLFGVTLYGIYR